MTSETMNNKRRKTEESVATYLRDLPIGILEHTASFLTPISRALFAVALTNNENNNLPNESGYSSIAGSDWETLDFGEVEKDLATKLSDDDISAVLQHIDAVNNLKRLRLTNCTKITGVGLELLHGSTVIEQIDLSLTGVGENVRLDPEPPISCDLVLPILDSIIAVEGCSLKYLQFPYKWGRHRSTDSDFHAFIIRYNDMRRGRDTITCLNCDRNLPPDGGEWIPTRAYCYAIHSFTCYQCTKHYCYDCGLMSTDLKLRWLLRGCHRCERQYCKDCVEIEACCGSLECDQWDCKHCELECNDCNDRICRGCVGTDGHACSYCDIAYCEDCNEVHCLDAGPMMVRFCSRCNKYCCNSCRLRKYQEGGDHCDGCIILLPHEETLLEQVEQLKNEVSALKLVCKELVDGTKTNG